MAARGLGEWTRGDDGSVALEQRLQGEPGLQDIPGGAAPGLQTGTISRRVFPAMAHFHSTFMASPYLNRLEPLLRCYTPGCLRGAAQYGSNKAKP